MANRRQNTPLLVVISGPSGVGKDAVLAEMRRLYPEMFFAVTATTRPMRPGEVDGRDYLFLSEERFQELLRNDGFLEHANVYGRWYGVPRRPVREALEVGRDAVLKVDVQGAATIRRLAPEALLIFLAPPDMAELERRLRARKTESPEQMAVRIETARDEMRQADWFDYVVMNATDALQQTVRQIVDIMDAERRREPPRRVVL